MQFWHKIRHCCILTWKIIIVASRHKNHHFWSKNVRLSSAPTKLPMSFDCSELQYHLITIHSRISFGCIWIRYRPKHRVTRVARRTAMYIYVDLWPVATWAFVVFIYLNAILYEHSYDTNRISRPDVIVVVHQNNHKVWLHLLIAQQIFGIGYMLHLW